MIQYNRASKCFACDWINMRQDKAASTLVVMPSRRRLLFRLIIVIVVAGAILAVYWFLHLAVHDWRQGALGVLVILLCVQMAVFQGGILIHRMTHPAPSIVVREDGILDNASLIYGGIGFIPWSEIAAIAVRNVVTEPFYGIWRKRFLVIVPVNWQEYERTLPLRMRLQRRVIRWGFVWSLPIGIYIPHFMLPDEARFVRLDISTAYYKWHPHVDGLILFD